MMAPATSWGMNEKKDDERLTTDYKQWFQFPPKIEPRRGGAAMGLSLTFKTERNYDKRGTGKNRLVGSVDGEADGRGGQ